MTLGIDEVISTWRECGEAAIIFYFSGEQLVTQNTLAIQFANSLREQCPEWITDIVPSFDSVMVCYDPLVADQYKLLALVRQISEVKGNISQTQNHIIRACYDRSGMLDLIALAESSSLDPEDIIRSHANKPYRIFAIGFAPGFAYAGELEESIQIPRQSKPRIKVPAGAIAIADSYTAVYPNTSPGGWNLIGMLAENEPTMLERNLRVGDTITFVDVEHD